MNTNTLKQAARLKELGIKYDSEFVWCHKFGPQPPEVCIRYHTSPLIFITSGDIALTLDDLHRVLVELLYFPFKNDLDKSKYWGIQYTSEMSNCDIRLFDCTKNHAEDWTEILIWLLENNHVTAEQVNEALS